MEIGADDYVAKPFSPKVLNARVKTLLRRNTQTTPSETDILKRDGLIVNPVRHEDLGARYGAGHPVVAFSAPL